MAEVDPLTGSPLSRENRNAFFNTSTVPSSTFRGANIGAKAQVAEQSKKFVGSQQQNQTILANIQQQFQNLQNQINSLAQGIDNIYKLIRADSQSEQNLLAQEQQQETRNYQRQLRIGREGELEQKIENALVAPVTSLTNKVENIFGRVGSALSSLFLGWLGVRGIKALQAWRDKDNDALENIKNNILKNIGWGVGAIAAIKIGLFGVKSALSFVIRTITGLIFNAIRLPFRAAARGASSLGAALAGRGGARTPPTSGSAAAASSSAKPRSSGGGLNLLAGGMSFISNLIEGKGVGESAAIAGGGMVGGKVGAKTGATVGSILGPKGALAGGVLGGIGGFMMGENFTEQVFNLFSGGEKNQDNTDNKEQYQPNAPISSPTESMVTPLAPTLPSLSGAENMAETLTQMTSPPKTSSEDFPYTVIDVIDEVSTRNAEKYEPKLSMMPNENTLKINQDANKSEEKIDNTKPLYATNINAGYFDPEFSNKAFSSDTQLSLDKIFSSNIPSLSSTEGINLQTNFELKPEQMESVPFSVPNIRPLKEPQPNVIVASAPQQKKIEVPGSVTITDVPLISSSNPDNFYVLYSQLNYNVVM
jgi:hypothetical protein